MKMWNVRAAMNSEKYLDLVSMVGKNKRGAFSDIKLKVWQKIKE